MFPGNTMKMQSSWLWPDQESQQLLQPLQEASSQASQGLVKGPLPQPRRPVTKKTRVSKKKRNHQKYVLGKLIYREDSAKTRGIKQRHVYDCCLSHASFPSKTMDYYHQESIVGNDQRNPVNLFMAHVVTETLYIPIQVNYYYWDI